jgi:hypothetical protein
MATQIAGKAQLRNSYGIKVERTAAVLPATATATIFNVTGGRIILTTLVGEVTTVCSGTATNVTINSVGTASAVTTPLATASAVTSLAVGNEFAFSSLGGAATIGAAVTQNGEIIVPAAAIQIVTSATNTGAMRWTITYIPLDDGATVAAA